MKELKRKLAMILALILCLNIAPIDAMSQLPHKGPQSAEVSYNMTTANPRVKITFNNKVQHADGYIIRYQNTTDKKIFESTTIDKSQNTLLLGKEGTLKTPGSLKPGQLYKYWVVPYHNEEITYEDGTKGVVTHYASDQDCTPGYFLTEFTLGATVVKSAQGNQEIKIKTEYIPGATYEIYYEESKVSNIEEVQLVLATIKADDYVDALGNVIYTLPNPEPGTEYTFYVKVAGLSKGPVFKGEVSDVSNIEINNGEINISNNKVTPQIVYTKVGVAVDIFTVGDDYILFSSKFSESFRNKIKYIEIRQLDEYNQPHVIGEVHQSQLQINEADKSYQMKFTYNRPREKTNYLVVIHFKDGTHPIGDRVPEDILTYIPPDQLSEPMRPQIPEPATQALIDQINLNQMKNFNEYFLKEDIILEEDRVKPISLKDTFHSYKQEDKLGIQFIFSGQRKAGSLIQDPSIVYDIWMFKDNLPKNYYDYTPLILGEDREEIFNKQGATIGFKEQLNQYITSSGVSDIIPNSTYYIAVRARNIHNANKRSEANIVAITLDREGHISNPPVLGKPPLRVQEENVTAQIIPIEWQKQWYELKAKNPAAYIGLDETGTEFKLATQWNSSAYEVSEAPKLRWTGKSEDRIGPFTKSFIDQYAKDYDSRQIKLEEDIHYEVKAIAYDEVIEQVKDMGAVGEKHYFTASGALSVEKWIQEKENKTQSDEEFEQGWQKISPVLKEGTTDWWQYSVSYYTDKKGNTQSLQPGKRYIMMMRTYREVPSEEGVERLYQAFPSYVIGLTKGDHIENDPIPSAPILIGLPHKSTGQSISVKWLYNSEFNYEVRYSPLKKVDNAVVWPFDATMIDKGIYTKEGDYIETTISGLLPETDYYVWVRALPKKEGQPSGWSNGVNLKTLEIEAPPAPNGLGIASKQSLLEIGQQIKPTGKDYLTIEWSRIAADKDNPQPGAIYTYQVEFANNEDFLDSITIRTDGSLQTESDHYTAEVLAKNIVKFSGLESNKIYYVRVKTILTYNLQGMIQPIIKESMYTASIKVRTNTSSQEYDGGENDNIIIYDDPIKETYKDGTWTYEIQDVASITSSILNKGDWKYTITMKYYKNRYDAAVRHIKIPKVVLDTLISQDMILEVITNECIYHIPARSLAKTAKAYQTKDSFNMTLTRLSLSDLVRYTKITSATYRSGEKLEVDFNGHSINQFEKSIQIGIKLPVVSDYQYKNYEVYQYQPMQGAWRSYPFEVEDHDNKYVQFQTLQTGLNTLYEKKMNTVTIIASYTMNQIASNYDVVGLRGTFKNTDRVKANQYVSLLMGIAKEASHINLLEPPSAIAYEQAKKAGIYISSSRGTLTKEQAIAGIVRLYEIKTGYSIKPSKIKIAGTSKTYTEAVSKAIAIGLIEDMNPWEPVTYGELCDWLWQVIV